MCGKGTFSQIRVKLIKYNVKEKNLDGVVLQKQSAYL